MEQTGAWVFTDLAQVLDMYLDDEQKHYEEEPSDDHIFHSLLNLSIWVKQNHTMKERVYNELESRIDNHITTQGWK